MNTLREAVQEFVADYDCGGCMKHECQYKIAGERLRRIEKLETVNQELLEALRLTSIDCQYLHHSHKDRHLLFEECPVVARINAAIAKAEAQP